jgi:hypothetical protein
LQRPIQVIADAPSARLHGAGRHDETVSGMRCGLNGARFAVAVAALVGVLAMHGFSSDRTSSVIASSGQVEACAGEPGMAHLGIVHAGVAHEQVVEAIFGPRLHSAIVAGPSHCAMSHAECLATLRDTAHVKKQANPALRVAAQLAALQRPAVAIVLPVACRAPPPDASLTRLCISRT